MGDDEAGEHEEHIDGFAPELELPEKAAGALLAAGMGEENEGGRGEANQVEVDGRLAVHRLSGAVRALLSRGHVSAC